ncbi:MAG: J domain-containing protein [Chloroflexi bacterium]|nr:J domain-containing protein [Chloroflexota bacterium]
MNGKDYYRTLEVDREASQQQIKEAYRRLAFQYHPDRNMGDAGATQRMMEINEAYAALSDAGKRSEYDSLRERYGASAYDRFRQTHTAEDIFRGSDVDQVFEELARMFGFRSSAEVFREFYGPAFRSFAFRRPGMAGRGFVFFGGSPMGAHRNPGNQAGFPGHSPGLPAFRFSGILGRLIRFTLSKTLGLQFPEKGKDWKDVIAVSQEQAEKGQEVAYSCRKWGKPRDLMVRIPRGINDGQLIRLSGMGAPGKGGGGPGDLHLRVRIRVPWRQRLRNFFRRAALMLTA